MLSEITLGRGGGIFLQSTQNVKLIAARSWSKKHCPGTATWQHWQHAAPSQPDGTLLSTYGTWGSCSVPGPTLCKCSSLEEAADLLTGSPSTPPPHLSLLPLDWDKALPRAHPAQGSVEEQLSEVSHHHPCIAPRMCCHCVHYPQASPTALPCLKPHREAQCV